jgi:hypothetical protein
LFSFETIRNIKQQSQKIINQLRIATQPAISKVMVDWGKLGTLSPVRIEKYHTLLSWFVELFEN